MDPTPLPELNSVTWRQFGLAPGLFLAGTGLLMQVAHPTVGAGVLQHSDFRTAPWKRAYRTHMSTMRFVYGLGSGANDEGDRLRELHKPIKGVDSSGRRYHALNPEAYAWVHFTLAQFMVETARWFGEPMTGAECEQMWREFRAIGSALGIKEHHMPATWADAQDWCHELLHTRLEANRSTQDVLDSISTPARPTRLIPNPLWALIARPAGHLLRLTTVGTMPPELRTRMGLRWSGRDQRRLERFARTVRALMRALPEPLRYAPLAYSTIARARAKQRRALRRTSSTSQRAA